MSHWLLGYQKAEQEIMLYVFDGVKLKKLFAIVSNSSRHHIVNMDEINRNTIKSF